MAVAGLVDIALLAICALLIALSFSYRLTIAQALVWVAKQLRKVNVHVPVAGTIYFLGWLADLIESVNGAILHYLGVAIENTSGAWKTLWHYQARAWEELAGAVEGAVDDTYRAVDGLIRHTIPAAIAAALAAILARLAALEAQGKTIVDHTTRTVVHEVTRIERVTVERTKVVAKAVALPRIGPLERDVTDLEKRVRELANRVGGAAIAGVVGFALARLGASWARCSKANRVGNQLCALDEDLLGSLVAGSLLLASGFALRELTSGTVAVMDELGGAIAGGVKELRGEKAIAFTGFAGAVDGRT